MPRDEDLERKSLVDVVSRKSYDSIENSSESNVSDVIPEDKYNLVYIIFFIQGIGLLLPWNIFITAHEYFTFRFDSDEKVKDTFENAFSVTSQVPNALFLVINLYLTGRISRGVRIIGGLALTGLCFLITDIMVGVDTKKWTDGFFGFTLVLVVVINSSAGILQGTMFGISGATGPRYVQGTMVGMGIGGIMVALANLISLAAGHGIRRSAFGYFTTAVIVIIICMVSYLFLFKTKLMKHVFYERVSQNPNDSTIDSEQGSSDGKNVSFFYIFKKIYPQALSVCLVFIVTLGLQPAIVSNIQSVNKSNGSAWTNKYFASVMCFLIFNTGDVAGRVIAGNVSIVRGNSIGLPLLVFLRIGFIPLFALCNYQPRNHLPVIFDNDLYPIIFNALLSVSNGYLASLCMMYGPQQVAKEHMEMAGAIMQLFLSLGLCIGAGLSYAIIAVI